MSALKTPAELQGIVLRESAKGRNTGGLFAARRLVASILPMKRYGSGCGDEHDFGSD